MALDILLVAGPGEFEAAFARAAAARVAAVVVQPIFVGARERIAEQATRHRLPWLGDNSEFGAAGALFAFGADRVALWQRTGVQAARVLDGAAAGDIPVEQPTRFNLVVNLRAARALGVTVPPAVLLRADEVVE
jgi:putative ABC transport system substrate-binding protein